MEETCVGEYIFLAGLDVLSRPYLLNDVHVPHTGLLFLWFINEIVLQAVQVI